MNLSRPLLNVPEVCRSSVIYRLKSSGKAASYVVARRAVCGLIQVGLCHRACRKPGRNNMLPEPLCLSSPLICGPTIYRFFIFGQFDSICEAAQWAEVYKDGCCRVHVGVFKARARSRCIWLEQKNYAYSM
jgi:hypothetical protein